MRGLEGRPLVRRSAWLVLMALAWGGSGCANKVPEDNRSVSGEAADAASALAYEHRVSISVAGSEMDARIQEARTACDEARFGPCELLEIEQRQGDWPSGKLVLRVAPEAVEPFVQHAAKAGRIGSRSTQAQDLSREVADTAQEMQRLQARRAELLAFRERQDLAVADMLALANEIATVDTQRRALEQQAAASGRRIATNLLTLEWSSYGTGSGWSQVGDALADAGDTAIEGLAESISYLAMLIPALLLAFPLALLWRAAWRRATKPRGGPTGNG
jgi:hypothetical protein